MIDKQTNARLKRFAQDARRYLIDQVSTKLSEVLAPDSDASTYEAVKPLYNALLKEVLGDSGSGEAALKPNTQHLTSLVERVAYTWFNRLTAIRYMDLHHFNPVGIISPQDGDSLPQILAEAKMGLIDSTLINPEDKKRVLGLLSGTVESTYHKGDAQSEAYRILLIGACNSIGKSLPFLFKPIQDWMQLLLPDDLLGEHGILAMIREVMTPEACADVEVIGWLYQYYISEKKDEVSASVKKGKKIQSKDIPAVTQLFTPHWIVKYMVQNSLGRLWLESHPRSSLKGKMEYYIAQPEAEGIPPEKRLVNSPEEIKFCDPCCGSGHILTYAFDLLYEIYSEEGYDPLDIPRLILSKNLFGIEIDERASELAAFALSMKAREKDRQWFSKGIDPQICQLVNIRFSADELEPYMDRCGRDIFTLNFEKMLTQFEDADTFGSLIVPYEQDIEGISDLLNAEDFEGDVFLAPTHNKVLKLIAQADYLRTKYQVVVTNPPYMGKGMSDKLSKFLNDNYKDVKSDLFSAFVKRCSGLGIDAAFIGIMSPNVWMYLSSYEKLRKWMITERTLTNLVELPLSGFTGATVQICAYNFLNQLKPGLKGAFVRLIGFKGADDEMSRYTMEAIANPDCGWFYRAKTSDFARIPGSPIAYWVNLSSDLWRVTISDCFSSGGRMKTHNNDRYLRFVWEVSKDNKIWLLYCNGGDFRKYSGNIQTLIDWSENAQYYYTKMGGMYNRKFECMEGITWSLITSSKSSFRIKPNYALYSSGSPTIFSDDETLVHPMIAFLNSPIVHYLLEAINPTLNTTVSDVLNLPYILKISSRVYNNVIECLSLSDNDWDSYETSWDFQHLPLLDQRAEGLSLEETYAKLREEWIENTLKMQELEEENNRIFIEAYGLQDELSPEVPLKEITLTCNPYYRYGVNAEVSGLRSQVSDVDFKVSGLRSQVSDVDFKVSGLRSQVSDVDFKVSGLRSQVSDVDFKVSGLRSQVSGENGLKPETCDLKPNNQFPLDTKLEERLLADTMKELISYAVGCMFGRYSVEKPGLILANQGETVTDFLQRVPEPSFMPQRENVIPILKGEWFADDLASRLQEFLKTTFGTANYYANLSYIEEALGKDILAYLIKDFYDDHVKRYKKRPIYWLFSSPKGSFNALIYLHRYTPDTVSILLNDYLREYIHKIRAKSQQLEHQLNAGALGEREKMLTRRQIERLQDEIVELEEWEAKVILPLAEKRLQIDLDDGVKVNYAKFEGALKRF